MLIDLQLHSTYSDGYFNPSELAKIIARQKIKIAALTDHYTVAGLGEFRQAARKYKIKTVNGLELYAKLGRKKFNILWYNFNEDSPELHALLRSVHKRRKTRVRMILEKMKKNGYALDINKIIDKYPHYIPVNRLADDIFARGKNLAKIKKALGEKNPRSDDIIRFFFYKNKDRNFTLRENHIDIKRIVALREKIGGQLILNHPGKYGGIKKPLIEKLKKLGLDGIEILSPHHSVGAIMYYQRLAKEYGLIETGGSDFHLHESSKYPLQNSWQYFKIEPERLKGVEKIIK